MVIKVLFTEHIEGVSGLMSPGPFTPHYDYEFIFSVLLIENCHK